MKNYTSDLTLFAENCEKDLLLNYYEKAHNHVLELNKNLTKQVFFLLLTVLIFFVVKSSKDSGLQLEFITIKDKGFILKALPIVFAWLCFRVIVSVSYRNQLTEVLDFLFLRLYVKDTNQKNDSISLFSDIINHNEFIKSLLLFSYGEKDTKQIEFLRLVVIYLIVILPTAIEITYLYEMLYEFPKDITTYLSLLVVAFFNYYSGYIIYKS